ncbi:MAG: hypothetical protein HC900_08875, partial [Methylacidiphilales bacterium]|nr:hypothetical protein [Candidatus Methylacidiphilales bacterium]
MGRANTGRANIGPANTGRSDAGRGASLCRPARSAAGP